ncbi:hypothetical protein H6P81_004764 [Aristolochia fimbriata]|uniref:Uncharacterized protein n=1 Tax=Aristolochia fimbriata TaxID=158543 RepID=A0AAV7ESL0_ARIFI|nr:hypothetical protein H6P81_004764 [Aristolochia fimbriata]
MGQVTHESPKSYSFYLGSDALSNYGHLRLFHGLGTHNREKKGKRAAQNQSPATHACFRIWEKGALPLRPAHTHPSYVQATKRDPRLRVRSGARLPSRRRRRLVAWVPQLLSYKFHRTNRLLPRSEAKQPEKRPRVGPGNTHAVLLPPCLPLRNLASDTTPRNRRVVNRRVRCTGNIIFPVFSAVGPGKMRGNGDGDRGC